MFSVMSVCSQGRPHVTITHDASDLTVQSVFTSGRKTLVGSFREKVCDGNAQIRLFGSIFHSPIVRKQASVS